MKKENLQDFYYCLQEESNYKKNYTEVFERVKSMSDRFRLTKKKLLLAYPETNMFCGYGVNPRNDRELIKYVVVKRVGENWNVGLFTDNFEKTWGSFNI